MTRYTLSEIFIYPIKSLGGIQLKKVMVQGKGLRLDRRWMLVNYAGEFLSQRFNPEMAFFKVAIQDNLISINIQKDGKIQSSTSFNIETPLINPVMPATIWDDVVRVIEVDTEISQWFSHHLNVPCKLVSFPEEQPRPVEKLYKINNEQVSLADAYPFLIIGQSSLDDLNSRLPLPLPMNRFRPNFVFTGGEAYEEDHWGNLSMGDTRFAAVKKTARCVLTTIDQDTGEKGTEPLRTLSEYRKVNNKIFFGKYLVARNEGEVSVGDSIIVSG